MQVRRYAAFGSAGPGASCKETFHEAIFPQPNKLLAGYGGQGNLCLPLSIKTVSKLREGGYHGRAPIFRTFPKRVPSAVKKVLGGADVLRDAAPCRPLPLLPQHLLPGPGVRTHGGRKGDTRTLSFA